MSWYYSISIKLCGSPPPPTFWRWKMLFWARMVLAWLLFILAAKGAALSSPSSHFHCCFSPHDFISVLQQGIVDLQVEILLRNELVVMLGLKMLVDHTQWLAPKLVLRFNLLHPSNLLHWTIFLVESGLEQDWAGGRQQMVAQIIGMFSMTS